MKVLRVMGCDSNQYGSIERFLVLHARRASERGHRMTIVHNSPHTMPGFVADAQQAGARLLSLDLPAGAPASLAARRLAALVMRERPEVIHGNFTPLCHYAMAMGAALGIERRFRTSMNMPWGARPNATAGSTPSASFAVKQRLLSRLPRRLVALSEVMKAEFVGMGVPAERVVVIPNGVDPEEFTPANLAGRRRVREEWGVGEDERLIGYLGRLVPIKAVHVILDAAGRVVQEHPRARFVIVGDGPLRPALQEYARSLGLEGHCRFVGHRADNRDVLAALDIVVHMSLAEGMSNSLLEAMATARPIVASAIPPNAEIVVDEETGLLVPLGDADGCAAALGRLVADDGLTAAMGRRGRERVQNRYTVEQGVAAELALYEGS